MTFRASMPTSTMTTAVVSVPRPGIRRPSSRSYTGVVAPSTTSKIQISAATLMNSGTVTKNPAMKLRRNQPISRHHEPNGCRAGEREAVRGKHVERVVAEIADEEPDRRVADDRRRDDADREEHGEIAAEAGFQHLRRFAGGRAENRRNREQEDEPGRVGAPQTDHQCRDDRRTRSRYAGNERERLRAADPERLRQRQRSLRPIVPADPL